MNVNKISSALTNVVQSKCTKKAIALSSDTFEKTTQGLAEQLKKLTGIEDLPIYQSPIYSNKPFTTLLNNLRKNRAFSYNSSDKVQETTLGCIQKVESYLSEKIEQGGAKIARKTTGEVIFELDNGIKISAYEPHNLMSDKYTPWKTLTISSKGDLEKIYLRAYNNPCNSAIYKFFNLTDRL